MEIILITLIIAIFIVGIMNVHNERKAKERRAEWKFREFLNKEKEIPLEETQEPDEEKSLQLKRPASLIAKIKGTSYRTPEEIAEARFVDVGDNMALEKEENNPYDDFAVKVITGRGYHIGYIEAGLSELVSKNIGNIDSCVVVKATRHEIPYIDVKITFGDKQTSPMRTIPKEYQVSPEDRMAHGLLEKDPKYKRDLVLVEGTYETNRETIAIARKLRKGDPIVLEKLEPSEYYPYRINVYTEAKVYLGRATSMRLESLYNRFDEIVATFVDSAISEETADRLAVSVIFPKETELRVPEDFSDEPFDYGDYPELHEASKIKSADPQAALDILMPIVKKERGISARLDCISCMYHLKMWEERAELIKSTIEHIEALTSADFPVSDLRLIKAQLPTLVKQLEFSIKRADSQIRKTKRKITP